MGKSKLGLFSVLLVISVLWKPAYTNECSTSCKGTPSSHGLAANTKYNYGFEGTVSVYLTGAADNKETSVKLLGKVAVTALGNCGHELLVESLAISGPDGKKYQSPPGIEKPVRFSLQDGRLSAEICASEGDTRRSLNIKRAIISLLQTEQKSTTQVDIFGACPTEIAYSAEGGATLVHRTRDLSRCAHREQGRNDLITSVLNENAEIKESQVLQSTLHAESKVNNGVPEKVSASEEYLYKPFSVGENGARAKVHSKLTLTGKAGGAGAGHCTVPRTIIFESEHGTPQPNNANSALAAVKETAKAIGTEASEKSAGEFVTLIRVLRVTSKDDLIKVWNQVKNNIIEKRVFLDALLRAGTGDSIGASIQILKSNVLSALEQQLVYLSLGNAKHVNDDALEAATGLLDQQNLPKEIYLGVGALAGAFCRSHDCHSTKSDGIAALSNKLGAKLQSCRPRSKVEEDNVVAVLKGIRSIRHLENSLVDKLVQCASDNNVKARVKAAALEAFLSDPCSDKIKKAALDIMKNRQLDSEIRIKGYLAVIACPCGKSANEISTLLETEPVHQVGRYITSSLRAIRASSNPDKQLARQHYGLIRTPNKFNVDDRKYSFYRESSFNVDALGVGGALEQSVIYSQNSFLPRSASFNLTTEIFGHAFNVLELGGRQGNLDLVVEHFLGPKGILKTKGPQAIYDILMHAFAQSSEKVKSTLSRGRRSIKSEIDNFDKTLKGEELHYDNELDLDVYVKLFGTDAVFLSLGDDQGFDYNKVLDKIMQAITEGIHKTQHLSSEFRTHLLLLDAQLSYPTSAGLPLRLDLTGAATARVDLSTDVDLKECFNNPRNAKIDIKFVPSSDIEITGTLTVDADTVATGLKVVTNLHSSTGGHLKAKVLDNGSGLDLQLDLPVEKQEILVASNDLVYITVEKGQKEKQTKIAVEGDRKEYTGCFDQLSGLLGLTLCGEVSLPFSVSGPDAQISISKYLARYPLSGQSKVKLVLEKNDLQGYHIRGVVRDEYGKTTLDLLFEAQGLKSRRRTQIVAEKINTPTEMGVKLSFDSPIKKFGGEVTIRNTPSELIALAKANIDAEVYYGKVGFNVAGNQQRSTYKPIFEYQLAGDQKYAMEIDGKITRAITGAVTEYKLDGINIKLPNSQEPMAVEGFFSNEANARNTQWELQSNMLTVRGSIKNNDVQLEFFNKLNAVINFILKGHFEFGDVIKNEFDIVYSGDCKDKSRRVIFGQFLKSQYANDKNYNVITKNKLEIVSIPFKIRFDADFDPKKLEVEFEFKNVDQKADLELKGRTHTKRPEDYSVKLNANLDKNGIEIFSKRDGINNDKSNFENYVVVKGLGKYELSGVVLHRMQPNDVNVGAVGHFKVTGGKNQDIQFDVGVIQTSTLYSSHAKITNNQGVLVDALLKVTSGPNADGLLKFTLKDAITANGQFQVTDADGKGNGMIIVDFKKSQRKIKADVKFQAKQPVYNLDFDIFLNWEKDNNDKIRITTHSKLTENSVDSNNKLEYGGKTTELNLNTNGGTDLIENFRGNLEIVLPTERCLTLKLDRNLSEKGGVYNGNANLLLSDAPKRGEPASTITYKGKLANANYDTGVLDYEAQLDFKIKDGKHMQNNIVLKNLKQGNKYKVDYKLEVTGNVLPNPATISGSATYLDSLQFSDDVYHVKASYGDNLGFDWAGVWEVKYGDNTEYKYNDDYTIILRLPFEKAHDIKWISTVLFTGQNKDHIEYTIIESVQVNADVYKIGASGKAGAKEGSGTVKLQVPHEDPVVLDTSYKYDDGEEKKALTTEFKVKYGKGKSAAFSVDTSASPSGNALNIKINAPQHETMKQLEIDVNSKHPAPDTYISNWAISADGRVYKSESTIVLSKAHPILDLKYTSPTNGKTSRIYVKGSSLSSTQGKVEVKIENVNAISLDAVSEASVNKDNVNFKVQANSKELGWNNFVGEIASKDAGSSKRLEFKSTNDKKNVLSGSTSFISKQEGQKTIIEGSGSVTVKDEKKSANFKYIRTILTEGNEKGVETFFNIAFGERSYVAESRVTNLEFKNSHVYCEEQKQCANAELQSKIDISKPGEIVNIINAGFDLRKLGIAPEVGLVIRDEVSTSKLPQFTLDLHANKEDRKYHLNIYNTPVFGHAKSGIKIELPSRVMILENSVAYPTDKPLPFPIKGELVLDLNKKKSGHKAAARFLVDVDIGNDNKQTAVAEFGFSHPKIDKEALVRISGAAIRVAENSFKIETTAKVSHSCLGRDREAKILIEASPAHFNFLVNTPLVKVIDVSASGIVQEKLQKANIKFVLLEGKAVSAEFLVKEFKYFEFTTGYTAEADRKLSVIGNIDPEKRVDISADIFLGGQKKNLAHGALWLENNEVKSDYGASKDHCDYFYKALRKDLDDLETRVKQLGEKASNDFKDVTRRVQPTLQKLQTAYEEDISQIYKEVADDKVLKEISQAFHDIVQYVASMIEQVITQTKPIIDDLTALYGSLVKAILEAYEKQIEPALKQLYTTIANFLKAFLDSVIEVVAHYAAFVTDFMEKHKVELQELTNTIAEIFKDITRLIVAQLKEYRQKVSEIFKEFTDRVKDLPIIQALREKWDELAVPEQVLSVVQQIHDTLRPLLPTPETQAFSDVLNDYVLKKLRKDKCDDAKELKVVYQKLVTAVASLIQFVRSQLNQYGVVPVGPQGTSWWNWNPANAGSAPALGGTASVSFLKQIISGDIPDLATIIKAYRPRSLNPLSEIPSLLRGVVVNGQHIFTFDGRHLTFPGTCRYVLAHDYVDRNFTLLMQMANGKPKALVLEDQNGVVIELKDNGQATLNGANHGYPIEEKESFAFRQANGRIGLGTRYGLMAHCSPKLEVCYIEVNGFYLGKLRGLLGDGNNEPYDDFRLPNGMICTSESEFGNAYRLTQSCAKVSSPAHSHHQLLDTPLPEPCEKVFGGSSPLRLVSLLLDISPFRQACIHAVASNAAHGLQEACDLGKGYAALAATGLLPVVLPDVCVQCTDVDQPKKIGEEYQFNLPGKQADIVVAIETTKMNEKTFKDMVVPLVAQVIEQLKTKRCTDVKVYLVGITSKFPYPVMHDTDQKLKNAKITFNDESRYDLLTPIKTGEEKVDQYIDQFVAILNGLKTNLGIMTIEGAYAQLLDIPLRPAAVKHYISVIGEHCKPENFLLSAINAGLHEVVFENNAISLSLVSVAEDLTIGNGKNVQQVVGFGKNMVLMVGDKKPGNDAEALRQSLEWKSDSCIDYVEEVDGLVLSSRNYFALNAGQRKQFLATAGGAIAHRMTHDTLQQECTCLYSDSFSARSVCINKDRKNADRRR